MLMVMVIAPPPDFWLGFRISLHRRSHQKQGSTPQQMMSHRWIYQHEIQAGCLFCRFGGGVDETKLVVKKSWIFPTNSRIFAKLPKILYGDIGFNFSSVLLQFVSLNALIFNVWRSCQISSSVLELAMFTVSWAPGLIFFPWVVYFCIFLKIYPNQCHKNVGRSLPLKLTTFVDLWIYKRQCDQETGTYFLGTNPGHPSIPQCCRQSEWAFWSGIQTY